MARTLKRANAERSWRDPRDWAETSTHTEIAGALDRARDGFCATMIAGAPGVGKTPAAQGCCIDMGEPAFCHRVDRGEGTPWELAEELLKRFERSPLGMSLVDAKLRLAEPMDPETLIVLDESQNLKQRTRKTPARGGACEWTRDLAETADCAIAC